MTFTAASVPVAARHRFTEGNLVDQPLRAMLAGQTADILYSSPPWDDAHVKMYAQREWDFGAFFHAFVSLIEAHVKGWVFIEVGLATVDAAAQELCRAVKDVSVHHTTYGPRQAPLKSCLLVGHTEQPVRGRWVLLEEWSHGGVSQPHGIIGSVCLPGQVLLDPVCTNVHQARAAIRHGLVFYGNDHNPTRAAAIRRILEAGRS
jgi:hypothetical protein